MSCPNIPMIITTKWHVQNIINTYEEIHKKYCHDLKINGGGNGWIVEKKAMKWSNC
jgi:hypothetical protein